MIAIRRILVPLDIDPSVNSALHIDMPNVAALKYGCEFAGRLGAELHILHVVEDITELEDCTHEAEREEAGILNKLKIEPPAGGGKLVRVIRKGRPFVEIIAYAREQAVDLIIMGTHGRKSLPHLLIGSETENTVRKAPCPVLVVRHPEHEFVLP
ncbi:MAG: universal stress protein [Candidatus Omnitrophica bacterium]|nr:universal stress protein [Candidatus Omnitrophota bacterium]MCB9720198.1 universal stress protein [Candidatus Omnitrophota bacterium]